MRCRSRSRSVHAFYYYFYFFFSSLLSPIACYRRVGLDPTVQRVTRYSPPADTFTGLPNLAYKLIALCAFASQLSTVTVYELNLFKNLVMSVETTGFPPLAYAYTYSFCVQIERSCCPVYFSFNMKLIILNCNQYKANLLSYSILCITVSSSEQKQQKLHYLLIKFMYTHSIS